MYYSLSPSQIQECRDLASSVLSEVKQDMRLSLPINLDMVIGIYEPDTIIKPFYSESLEKMLISGLIFYDDLGRSVIEYNNNDCLERQHFTVAHEFGHDLLGHLDSGATKFCGAMRTSDNLIEDLMADQVAAELLMPIAAMKFLKRKGYGSKITAMTQAFNVSEPAMWKRLRSLGMVGLLRTSTIKNSNSLKKNSMILLYN
jgi:Zn-dependent peptidase ImmA (M78 family)